MTKLPAILSAALSVSMVACTNDHKPIGQPVVTPLVTPAKAVVGSVTLFNSTDGLFVTVSPSTAWQVRETRLSVGLSLSGLPRGHGGDCDPDGIVLRRSQTNSAGQIAYALPLLVQPGTELFLAVYARLVPEGGPADGGHEKDRSSSDAEGNQDHGDDGDHGQGDQDRGDVAAWAQGIPFGGPNGSMYLTYVVRDSASVSLLGQYTTYSQATWGAVPAGQNPASLLATNFPMYYPSGVTIGAAGGFSDTFTVAQAVLLFLPQSGNPGPLMMSMTNPVTMNNTLAGDTLALALNVTFDAKDSAFSTSSTRLGSLVVADPSSLLYGLSVQQVLDTANAFLSGQPSAMSVSAADLDTAVSRINANFDGGTVDQGFLGMP